MIRPAGCFADFQDYLNQEEDDVTELTDETVIWDGDMAQHEDREKDAGAR